MENAQFIYNVNDLGTVATATYTCSRGYELRGDAEVNCDASTDLWEDDLPTCEPGIILCSFQPCRRFVNFVSFFVLTVDNLPVTPTTSETPAIRRNEEASAQDVPTNSVQLHKNCKEPLNIGNANYEIRTPTLVVYTCLPGFEMHGNAELNCNAEYGAWLTPNWPSCLPSKDP